MPRQRKFVPMGVWAPDAPDMDTEALAEIANLLPVYGSYRSCPSLVWGPEIITAFPINGAHVHLLAPRQAVQTHSPDETITNDFDIFGTDDDGLLITDAWEAVGADPPKDDSGLRIREDGNSPADADLRMPDFTDPGVDTDHTLVVRYNLRLPEHLTSFSLYAQLTDGGVDVTGGRITVTTGEDGYSTEELVMDEADVLAAVLDYTDLGIDLHAEYVVGTATETIDPDTDLSSLGWIRDAGSDPGLTFSEILSEDAGYLRKDDSGVYLTSMLDVVEPGDLIIPGTWTLKVGVGCELDTADVTVRLLSAEDEIMSDDTEVVSTTTLTNFDYDITPAMLQSINDWDQINVEVTLERTNATGFTAFRPEYDQESQGTWVATGAAGGWEATSQAGDPYNANIYVANTDGDPEEQARIWFRLADITYAQADDLMNLTVHMHATGLCKVEIALFDGNIPGNSSFKHNTSTHTNTDFTVTMTDVNMAGKDPTDIYVLVRLVPRAGAVGDRFLKVFQILGETADDTTNEMRLFRVRLERPTSAGIEIVHTEFSVPALGVSGPGDQPFLYAGNTESLFSVGDLGIGFIDKSNTSDKSYGTGDEAIANWDFVSWGTWVIGTNGSDPIQVQKGLGRRFEDLIPTPGAAPDNWEEPLARYCAVVKDFLFIANIVLPGDVTGSYNEYTCWWSRINEPDKFYKIDTTGQSDSHQFVTTPGEITALMGGEEATVYKVRSISRMKYVGYPLYFSPELVADNEGTRFGNSVVKVGSSQYFLGAKGFMHLPAQGDPVPIGDGQVTRVFTDTLYEDLALYNEEIDDIRQIQNLVTGAYDPVSGLILWIYRRKTDTQAYLNTAMITYSPTEGRWSYLPGDGDNDFSYIVSSEAPIFPHMDGLMRHFMMFKITEVQDTWVPDDPLEPGLIKTHAVKFAHRDSYEASFKTKPVSAGFITKRESDKGQNASFFAIRPIFKKAGEEPLDVEFCATLEVAEDRWMSCELARSQDLNLLADADTDGWMELGGNLSGEFVTLEASIPPVKDQIVRELIGIEYDLEAGGR